MRLPMQEQTDLGNATGLRPLFDRNQYFIAGEREVQILAVGPPVQLEEYQKVTQGAVKGAKAGYRFRPTAMPRANTCSRRPLRHLGAKSNRGPRGDPDQEISPE